MKISVGTSLNVENISSRRNNFGLGPHFCQQNEHLSVKKMKRTHHLRSCQLSLEYCACLIFITDILFTSTSTSTFIKLVKSIQTSHQSTRARGEKTVRRLEIILRTIVIKKRARNIPIDLFTVPSAILDM